LAPLGSERSSTRGSKLTPSNGVRYRSSTKASFGIQHCQTCVRRDAALLLDAFQQELCEHQFIRDLFGVL
jgi:hypothetical protein